MWPYVGGIVGIFAYLLADASELSGRRVLRGAVVVLSAGVYGASFAVLLLSSQRLRLSPALRIAAAVVAVAAVGLLVLSLVVELRRRRPGRPARAAGPRAIVTTGTYALCRHPGVLWLFFAHLSIALAADARELLLALPPWIAADLLLAAIEDRVLFPRLFGAQYAHYRKSTPFLVPTRRSIVRSWRTRRGAAADAFPTSPLPADDSIRRTT